MPAALVSVLIPVHNDERYLGEAIASARAQTLDALEIIVIDDGSTDASPDIARAHAREDSRVRVIHQERRGLVGARNRGLAEAQAPWVALLDADDTALPERLERQLAFVSAHPDVRLLGTYGWRMGAGGGELGVFDVGPRDHDHFARLRAANEPIFLLASSVLVSREVALACGGFRDLPCEDVDLWTRIADEHVVLALRERLVRYRVRSGSLSDSNFHRQQCATLLVAENARRRRDGLREMALDQFMRILDRQPAWERARRILAWRSRYWYRVAGARLANRDPSGAFWLAGAFLLAPTVPLGRLRRQLTPWFAGRLMETGSSSAEPSTDALDGRHV